MREWYITTEYMLIKIGCRKNLRQPIQLVEKLLLGRASDKLTPFFVFVKNQK